IPQPSPLSLHDALPISVAVGGLRLAVAPSKTRRVTVLVGREGTVAHEGPKDDLPLEGGEAVLDCSHHPVPNRQVLRLPPAPWSADQMVGSARETSPATADGTSYGELQELLGWTVVKPVHYVPANH